MLLQVHRGHKSIYPRESNHRVFWPLRNVTLPFADTIKRASVKCKQSPVYGVFDRYVHIPLPIVTKHELGLPFPPRNLCIKFGTNSSTMFLVILVTNTQTHKQTNAGENIFPRFRRDN